LKRRDLLRHLEAHGCEFLREGSNHTVYVNRTARKVSTVPRHREVNDDVARKICKFHVRVSKALALRRGLVLAVACSAGLDRG